MVRLALFVNKSIDENAAYYFEEAKQAKKKLQGAELTLESFQKKKAEELTQSSTKETSSEIQILQREKKLWYEKFKWFVTSEGFLVVGARDATTNEILVKKHTQTNDVIFHTDMAGSPFVVIKKDQTEVKKLFGDDVVVSDEIGQLSLQEAASFTAIHSKAWKLGLGSTRVFYVQPDQVSKEANSGEYMSKGSFMIRGKTTYVEPIMSLSAGIVLEFQSKEISPFFMSGPTSAIMHWSKHSVLIEQGNDKSSDVAKSIRQKIQAENHLSLPLDEIIKHLPSGGCQIKKERKRKSEL